MPSNTNHRHGLLVFVGASLAIHGLLLALRLPPPTPVSGLAAPGITLVREPEPHARLEPAPATADHPPATAAETSRDTTPPSEPEPETETGPIESLAAVDSSEPTKPARSAAELRQQILTLAGRAIDSDQANGPEALPGITPIPRLPGQTGWLDAYVGPVSTGTERWKGTDGTMNSRTVLASGQVVCASVRPPTMDEFFNPWMSAALSMLSDCGRERPRIAHDSGDPWQRPPRQSQ